MADSWRLVEMYLPGALSPDRVTDELRAGILRVAADCGEFVDDICVVGSAPHPEGWRKWRMAYMPGPPGVRWGSACGAYRPATGGAFPAHH